MIHVDSTTNPYIISNFHLLCKASSCTSLFCIKCMSRCINTYSWSKENIISNLNSARIKHHTVKVCIKMISYLDIITKLTSERWLEKYILYGTPLESTTYKFAKCLQKRFGIVPGITDRNYITNSYHVHVTEQIDAFTKLKFESEFQRLSPGGAISYVEVPNMQDNLEAVIKVMQFIYDNIMYAELNTKSDYCQVCGYDGEIKIVEDDGKLVWECPHCHNRDQSKLNVARRTCGYIGTQFWNQGRTAEIKDRVLHL